MPLEPKPTNNADHAATGAVVAESHKRKQLLVIFLLIGLLVAILTQPSENDTGGDRMNEGTWASQTQAPPDADNPRDRQAKELAAAQMNRLTQTRQLSRIELEQIMGLELLVSEPRRSQARRREDDRHVQAIYGTRAGRAALLGESIVRRGQPLPDGGKVMNVTTDGIQIAR